jgi:hypothetical protein
MTAGGRHGGDFSSTETQDASRHHSASRNPVHYACTFLFSSVQRSGCCEEVLRKRHCTMLAVQLLDFLNVQGMHHKNSRTSMADSSHHHWGGSSRIAALPTGTSLNYRSASHATLLPAHHFERFLKLLIMLHAKDPVADARSAPACHPGSRITSLYTPGESQTPSVVKNEAQHKLSRWPWSVMGREVCTPDSS